MRKRVNVWNILTENCSLQKNEHIDEENREEKACEHEVEYGKQSFWKKPKNVQSRFVDDHATHLSCSL